MKKIAITKKNTCHICMKNLDSDKVKDYCYFIGKYRGAAHNTSNLKYKIQKNIPVSFHNGSTIGLMGLPFYYKRACQRI